MRRRLTLSPEWIPASRVCVKAHGKHTADWENFWTQCNQKPKNSKTQPRTKKESDLLNLSPKCVQSFFKLNLGYIDRAFRHHLSL